jgi:dual specificity MAP kinase phosphatase
LIDSSELAEKLKENFEIIIFDCGSPIRYSENHIFNSYLLRVSDKISRKRLKTNPIKHSTIDIKQLNQSNLIILYDDNINNHQELSVGLKCAYEEIQRCLTNKSLPIYILKTSFNHFLNLYPQFCQSEISIFNDTSTPILSNTNLENYPMTEILNGLFIGSESNAQNLDELSSEHIRYIINVTSHVPLYHSEQFHYYHIPADDTQKQNLLDYFDEAYKFILNAIENNEKILVHCVAGISRSPAIVISFLMRYAHMNMNDAYEFVKTKRSIVSPNLNFMGQLLQYEKKLKEQK